MIRNLAKILFLSAAALLFSGCSQQEDIAKYSLVGADAQTARPAPDIYGGKPPIQDAAKWPLTCTINGMASTCRTEPAVNSGFTIYFSHAEGPIYTFTPVGIATTDRREMVDGSGQKWAMSGNRSFQLEEIGGYGNRITVTSP